MRIERVILSCATVALLCLSACCSFRGAAVRELDTCEINFNSRVDVRLQESLERVDQELRDRFGMRAEDTAAGVLDLRTCRLAMVRADQIDYAASVPKIAILLAYFALRPGAATNLDANTRHELGLMIKVSDNEIAAKYSQQLGLKPIQQVLDAHGFYDVHHGGGLWLGKHYSKSGERYGDPIANHSHAATVRQLLRFYLLLEQGRLVSPAASRTIREIFASPDIPHLDDKFVKGLADRNVRVLRKAGWWENWFHDTAIVEGANRHYIIVAMTHHPRGEEYLVEFARAVDTLLAP